VISKNSNAEFKGKELLFIWKKNKSYQTLIIEKEKSRILKFWRFATVYIATFSIS